MKFTKEKIEKTGLILGIASFLIILIFKPIEDLGANQMAAVAALMAIWWITEAIPLAATSLIPLLAYPFLEIMNSKEIALQYMNNTIFLFLGGFLLALGMEKWNLHKRISLAIINAIGGGAKGILLGFMISTWLMSMFITNTATTMMMLPIAMAVIFEMEAILDKKEAKNMAIVLMLGIAYSASMGGIATLVGTIPNMAFKSIYEGTFPNSPEITFTHWMSFGLPLSAIMMVVLWLVLTKILFTIPKNMAFDKDVLRKEKRSLGRMSIEEKIISIVMAMTSLLWIFRKDIVFGWGSIPGWSGFVPGAENIDDSTIAIAMSLLLFIIPSSGKKAKSKRLLDKDVIPRIPWDILLLFGGGFALAKGFQTTGLSEIIGNSFTGLAGVHPIFITFAVVLVIIFLTELTSNTATTYTFLPILASISVSLGIDPLTIMIPASIAASFAFMLPVATPPNAIVFGSGKLEISDMVRAGLWINIISAILIPLFFYFLPPSFG